MKEHANTSARTRERLERLARLLRTVSHAEGLNPAQWEVLRYLARANRFSNSPIAAAHYLGATKGTTSQTILALNRKGLVHSESRTGDSRSVALHLTVLGREFLARDPMAALTADLDRLKPKTGKPFAKALKQLLHHQISRQHQPEFGACAKCRYFLAGELPACASFGQRLESNDLKGLCHKFRSSKRSAKSSASSRTDTLQL